MGLQIDCKVFFPESTTKNESLRQFLAHKVQFSIFDGHFCILDSKAGSINAVNADATASSAATQCVETKYCVVRIFYRKNKKNYISFFDFIYKGASTDLRKRTTAAATQCAKHDFRRLILQTRKIAPQSTTVDRKAGNFSV